MDKQDQVDLFNSTVAGGFKATNIGNVHQDFFLLLSEYNLKLVLLLTRYVLEIMNPQGS